MGPPCVLLEIQRGLHNNAVPRRYDGEWLLHTSLVEEGPCRLAMCVCVCASAWQHLFTRALTKRSVPRPIPCPSAVAVR